MAEVDTQLLASQHGDIRREAAEHASEIRYDTATKAGDIRREAAEHYAAIQLESMKGFDRVNADVLSQGSEGRFQGAANTSEIIKENLKSGAVTDSMIKDARYETISRVESNADRLEKSVVDTHRDMMDRFYSIGRDTADLRAQVIQAIDTTKMSTELNALKGIIEGQKNTAYLTEKIGDEGEKTRGLINSLRSDDLNRALIERNAELVGERDGRRHWRHLADSNLHGGQYAALNSQLQAFASQLQETRQGMVNFGTMAGVGQTSTSNNVR